MDQSVDRSATRPAPWLACAIGGSLLLAVAARTVLEAARVEAQTGAHPTPASPATGSGGAVAHDTYGEAVALRARNALGDQVRRLTDTARTYLETTGDGCLVTFPAVTPALKAAIALVREWKERPPDLGPASRLDLRAGVTYGEILLDARGARHGAAINKAYRLLGVKPRDLAEVKVDVEGSALSERTRILVDEDATQEAGHTAGVRFVGYARLRGFTGLHGIYEATWQARISSAAPAAAAETGRRAVDRQGGTS